MGVIGTPARPISPGGESDLLLRAATEEVQKSVEQRTSEKRRIEAQEPRAGRSGTAMSGCRSMLERPESRPHHNVAGNGMRDGLKSERIG